MSDVVIQVNDLSKQYRLGQISTGTLAHDINRWWHRVRGKEDPYLKIGEVNDRTSVGASEYVWALRDLNFEVQRGDALGIIGRNGAGKSTLLKILSRTTAPTTGKVKLKGRIASLLEVGTGFHPELSGRENIFLNGAILGMTKNEIKRKFDEIVSFAGVERYIDTPVKRYSSGMYVRLAFGVAAHLESEILIVDEVLAVGDAEFQKKCLGKMKDVSRHEGRTVLFVSHNMAAVKSLCNKGLILKHGGVVFEGTQLDAVSFYQNTAGGSENFIYDGHLSNAPGNDKIRVLRFEVLPEMGDVLSIFSGIEFKMEFFNSVKEKNIDITFEVTNQDEVVVFHSGGIISKDNDSREGVYEITCQLPTPFLNAGYYNVSLIFGENQRYLLLNLADFVRFEVLHEASGSNSSKLPGVTFPNLRFSHIFKELSI